MQSTASPSCIVGLLARGSPTISSTGSGSCGEDCTVGEARNVDARKAKTVLKRVARKGSVKFHMTYKVYKVYSHVIPRDLGASGVLHYSLTYNLSCFCATPETSMKTYKVWLRAYCILL